MNGRFRTIPGTLAFLLASLLPGSPSAVARPWKNDTGQVIEADLVAVRDDSAVLSRDGKEFVFPISKLSAEDREFLKNWHPPVPAPKTPTFAGQPLETGGKVNVFEFYYGPTRMKELKEKFKSDETRYKITIVTPADFDPAKPQHVFIPSSAMNTPEEAAYGNADIIGEYTKACLDNGWVCLTTDSDLGITANFASLENSIVRLDYEWPGFKNWSFATGGFSGGGKSCYYVAAELIKTGHRVIGTFMGACNEDWSTKCRTYINTPVAGYRGVNAFLSVGKNDKLATPEICGKIEHSLHTNGITSTRLESFDGGHELYQPHIGMALNWFVEKDGGR